MEGDYVEFAFMLLAIFVFALVILVQTASLTTAYKQRREASSQLKDALGVIEIWQNNYEKMKTAHDSLKSSFDELVKANETMLKINESLNANFTKMEKVAIEAQENNGKAWDLLSTRQVV